MLHFNFRDNDGSVLAVEKFKINNVKSNYPSLQYKRGTPAHWVYGMGIIRLKCTVRN